MLVNVKSVLGGLILKLFSSMADELSTGKLDEFHTADIEYLKKQSRENLVKYISSLRGKVNLSGKRTWRERLLASLTKLVA